ncbi:hypothetical protein B9G55_12375 [Saccharibacillus sp. O16]|nr:hypothetical protein B9G55_12375 [Saccharibacillus sp. O16]
MNNIIICKNRILFINNNKIILIIAARHPEAECEGLFSRKPDAARFVDSICLAEKTFFVGEGNLSCDSDVKY